MSNKENIPLSELLYLLYFGILFLTKSLGVIEGTTIYSIALVLGFVCYGMKLACTKHTLFECICIALLLGLGAAVYYFSGEKGILLCVTMLTGMKGVTRDGVMKLALMILSVCMAFNIFTAAFGYQSDYIMISKRPRGVMFRHSLGYPYPTSLLVAWLILVMLVAYHVGMEDTRRWVIATVVMVAITIYLYVYSDSRGGVLAVVFFIFLVSYFKTHEKFYMVDKALIWIAYAIMAFFPVIGPMVIGQKLFTGVFGKLGSMKIRWEVAEDYLSRVPFTPFGSKFELGTYGLDMSPMYLFLQLGVVTFIIINFLWVLVIRDSIKRNDRIEVAIIVVLLLMGMTEPFLYNLSFRNIAFIYMGKSFFQWSQKHMSSGALSKEVGLSLGDKLCKIKRVRIGFERKLDVKELIGLAGLYAAIAGVIFLVSCKVFPVHETLYMSETSAGKEDLIMDPTYLSKDEVSQLKKEGYIVSGYKNEETDMYEYGGKFEATDGKKYNTKDAVIREYRYRNMSRAVWGSLLITGIFTVYLRKKKDEPK